MKNDYNQIMQKEISSFGNKPKLLLHCCCAPCSSAVIERIANYFDITYFYFNPNIYPESEYNRRKEEFSKLNINITSIEYDHNDFLRKVKGLEQEKEGSNRCRVCIAYRMEKAFEYAKNKGFDLVTTTLSISPHKDVEFINKTGESLETQFNIKYLHADFKKQNGYLRSIQICKEKGIYRQNYCGCEFSKSDE